MPLASDCPLLLGGLALSVSICRTIYRFLTCLTPLFLGPRNEDHLFPFLTRGLWTWIFLFQRVWPRAFFTDGLVAYEHEEEFIDLLKKSDGTPFAGIPREELDTQTELAKLAGTSTTLTNRKATPATDYVFTNNTTSFKINAPGPGVIVLTEAYVQEDFQVRLDGKPANYFRVNSAFKGLFVPKAGNYLVSYTLPRYPAFMWYGRWSSDAPNWASNYHGKTTR